MVRESKCYKINRDFNIECVTETYFTGRKIFNIIVYQSDLPFEVDYDAVYGIETAQEANMVFQQFIKKYKNMVI